MTGRAIEALLDVAWYTLVASGMVPIAAYRFWLQLFTDLGNVYLSRKDRA